MFNRLLNLYFFLFSLVVNFVFGNLVPELNNIQSTIKPHIGVHVLLLKIYISIELTKDKSGIRSEYQDEVSHEKINGIFSHV